MKIIEPCCYFLFAFRCLFSLGVMGGPDGSKSYIYIADVGDNFRRRGTVQIYRLEEPEVPEDRDPAEIVPLCAE